MPTRIFAGLLFFCLFIDLTDQAGGQSPRLLVDRFGDALPPGAVLRLGTIRWRTGATCDVSSALAGDGRTIFVGNGKTIRVFDLETGKPVKSIKGSEHGIAALALSPDGKVLASAGWGVDLWDAATGKKLRRLGAGTVRNIAFSPNGKKLISGRVFDLSGNEQENFLWHQQDIHYVACAPDGKTVVSRLGDGKISIADLTTGEEIRTIKPSKSSDPVVALSPSGTILAVADSRYQDPSRNLLHTIRLVDTATGNEEIGVFGDPRERTTDLAFSADSKLFASVGDKGLHVWDVASGKEKCRFAGEGVGLHFTPDGERVIAIGEIIRVWDVERGKELHPPEGPAGSVSTLAFSPDGKILAASSFSDPRIFLWEAASGKLLRILPGHDVYIRPVSSRSDGKVVSSDGDSPTRVWDWDEWDVDAEKPIFAFKVHQSQEQAMHPFFWQGFTDARLLMRCVPARDSYTRSVHFAPDGKLISGGGDSTLRVWDVNAGRELHRFKLHEPQAGEKPLQVLSMTVSRDARTLAAACRAFETTRETKVFVWDLANGKLLRQSQYQVTFYYTDFPTFSPDGNVLLRRDGRDLVLKDSSSGKKLRTLEATQSSRDPNVPGLDILEGPFVFSSDGMSVAMRSSRKTKLTSESRDNYTIRIFDLATGKERHRIPVGTRYPCLAFSSDGKRLAAGQEVIHIWDAATAKELWRSPNLDARAVAIAFSADGTRLASGLDDTTILIWDVGSAK
jgi:WD40 repeat protein